MALLLQSQQLSSQERVYVYDLLKFLLLLGGLILLWLLLCWAVGKVAKAWGMSFWIWFLLAVLFSPVLSFLGCVLVRLVSGTTRQVVKRSPRRSSLPMYSPIGYPEDAHYEQEPSHYPQPEYHPAPGLPAPEGKARCPRCNAVWPADEYGFCGDCGTRL